MLEGLPEQNTNEAANEQPLSVREKALSPEEKEYWHTLLMSDPNARLPDELRVECGPSIAEFLAALEQYESTFPLDELYSITDLTPEEAASHPLREPARKALAAVFAHIKYMDDYTDISKVNLDEMKKRYKKISNAVGMINKGNVDHTR